MLVLSRGGKRSKSLSRKKLRNDTPSTDRRRFRLGAGNNRFCQFEAHRARLRNRLPQKALGRSGRPSGLPIVVFRLQKWKTMTYASRPAGDGDRVDYRAVCPAALDVDRAVALGQPGFQRLAVG